LHSITFTFKKEDNKKSDTLYTTFTSKKEDRFMILIIHTKFICKIKYKVLQYFS